MFKNYLKTAWRNIWKNKFFTSIHILGLTVGLAIGTLILIWVQDELTFDSFYPKSAQLYKLELFGGTGYSRQIWSVDVAPMGPLAKEAFPEVIDQARITSAGEFSLYRYGDEVFNGDHAVFVDPAFFSMFDLSIVNGKSSKPFIDDQSVVLTEKAARKYFGRSNALGKIILANDSIPLTVSAVIANFQPNSSFDYELMLPMSYHIKSERLKGHDIMNDFSTFNYELYLQLKPQTSISKLRQQLNQLHLAHKAEDTDVDYLIQPISENHLYQADGTDRGMKTVKIFIAIALVILLIACINYVNLSTARAMLRAKEVSTRKIIGAGKGQLFMQFILETVLLFLFVALLAIVLMSALMPIFNELSGKQLVLDFTNKQFWGIFFTAIGATLIASSIYPALLLSSFEPLKALKGKISNTIGDLLFRKILVVIQFVFSIVLIASTILITKQLHYMRTKDLGYNKDQVLGMGMHDLAVHYDAIKAELLKQPGISDVTRSMGNILWLGNITGDNHWDGKQSNTTFILHPVAVDYNFLSFYKMKLQQGKNFSGMPSDSSHFILNETAIKEAGIKEPIGKRFRLWDKEGTIIGVVKDFHFESMKNKIKPAIFYYAPEKANILQIKTTSVQAQQAINAAESQFKKYNASYPFSYLFLDDIFNYLYQGELHEATLFNYFSAIAIFLSCLGLLGLTVFTAQARTKEIGIRKVLGANTLNIVQLMAAGFLRLVLIAIAIALPIAWLAMHAWLASFAYRTELSLWIFIMAGIIAMLIAFLTISHHSIKAAITNPVKSLRNE
ncbi:ABC transporter permease [Olivibacter ginsenosidimutans]|uniref:ABC transporter permease n=1 Tax=Olivibacter ginsenosidimutans TaxID=1176537 RepID=A0ABP9AVP8_9SPHI